MSLKKLFVLCMLVFTFLFVMAADAQACHLRYYVGWYVTDSNVTYGFRYTDMWEYDYQHPDVYETIEPDGAAATYATGVNNDGHVVGYYVDSNGYSHGFRWTGGSNYTIIDGGDINGAVNTVCHDINNYGYVVGHYEDSNGECHGFKWDGNSTFTYPIEYDGNSTSNKILGIKNNDNNKIVGTYTDANGNEHGFYMDLSNSNNDRDIDYPEAVRTWPRKLNDDPIVIGSYEDSSGHYHGFTYDYSSEDYDAIDYPQAYNTHGQGINDAGVIVGYYKDAVNYKIHGYILESSSYTAWNYPGTGIDQTRLQDVSGDIPY